MTITPKRYGSTLPATIDTGSRICFTISINDQLEYRAALYGRISELCQWYAWQHTQADYQDIPERNKEAAALWNESLFNAVWEECMSFCEQVANAIDDCEDVQHQIARLIETNTELRDNLADFIREHPTGSKTGKNQPIDPGTPVTITQPGECDLDVFYAQCVGLVQLANRCLEDFIQTWETYTNSGEVVSDMLNSIPLLSELAQASGVSGVIEYANDLVDAVGEAYLADYTEAYEIALSCELFCAGKDACTITIAQFADIMNTRIGNALNLSNVLELIVSLTDQDISGFNVADLYIAFFVNALSIGNIVLPVTLGIDTFLQVMATFDSPNNDWETLCDDCPPPVEGLWSIYTANPFSSEPCGTITSQDDHSVNFASTVGGDGKYRISGIATACLTISSGSITGTLAVTGDCGCGGYVGALVWPGGYEDRFYAVSDAAFTMTGTF